MSDKSFRTTLLSVVLGRMNFGDTGNVKRAPRHGTDCRAFAIDVVHPHLTLANKFTCFFLTTFLV